MRRSNDCMDWRTHKNSLHECRVDENDKKILGDFVDELSFVYREERCGTSEKTRYGRYLCKYVRDFPHLKLLDHSRSDDLKTGGKLIN